MMEDEPVLSPEKLVLERLSETELEARIAALRSEIAACEAELEKKRHQRNAADALFGKTSD